MNLSPYFCSTNHLKRKNKGGTHSPFVMAVLYNITLNVINFLMKPNYRAYYYSETLASRVNFPSLIVMIEIAFTVSPFSSNLIAPLPVFTIVSTNAI
jgi:hypothetical protein